jgi:hypothetical protein
MTGVCKSTGKSVPWESWQEWRAVHASLTRGGTAALQHADSVMDAWNARCKAPVGVEATALIVRVLLFDVRGSVSESDDYLELQTAAAAYGTAITRTVNLLTDNTQKGEFATSVELLARRLDIPSWIVQLRHSCCHGATYPTLSSVRSGAEHLLNRVLLPKYWDTQEQLLRPKDQLVRQVWGRHETEEYINALSSGPVGTQLHLDESSVHYITRLRLSDMRDTQVQRARSMISRLSPADRAHLLSSLADYGDPALWRISASESDNEGVFSTSSLTHVVDFGRCRDLMSTISTQHGIDSVYSEDLSRPDYHYHGVPFFVERMTH